MIVLDDRAHTCQGAAHPVRGPCRDLLAAVADGRLEATTTVEVIEGLATSARAGWDAPMRRGRRGITQSCRPPLHSATGDELRGRLSLFERRERCGSFDAVLVACAAAVGSTA